MLDSAEARAVDANGITRPGSGAPRRIASRELASAMMMDTSDGIRLPLVSAAVQTVAARINKFSGSSTTRQPEYRRASVAYVARECQAVTTRATRASQTCVGAI